MIKMYKKIMVLLVTFGGLFTLYGYNQMRTKKMNVTREKNKNIFIFDKKCPCDNSGSHNRGIKKREDRARRKLFFEQFENRFDKNQYLMEKNV